MEIAFLNIKCSLTCKVCIVTRCHHHTGNLTNSSRSRGGGRALQHAGQRCQQHLAHEGALKLRRANNSLVATRARDTANTAHTRAQEVKQLAEGRLEAGYQAAQELVQNQARSALQARLRAERLRDEAKALLQDAQGKLQRLTALEGSYQENELVLEEKAAQLDGLEAKVKGIVGAINQQIQIYNTCQ